MVILWIAFIVCALIQNSPFVVRISSLSGILTSLAIFTETSFEWLLKRSQRKQKERKVSSRKLKHNPQQPKSQASIAASNHLSEHNTTAVETEGFGGLDAAPSRYVRAEKE
ncbi:hypothetical protein BCR44DRAFT_1445002 [Catenaria anguillulae PL171]|uniref:Uncharacterized protein n=1 Tax=Catenaria anguillulae PL171 TaxID=765915 RepID=A0A1Y2H7B9_9FUNG|nr:hypothetical protein BCR44DRAFT_1445002 [Catenaria anguillulae PL171]